MKLLCIPFIEKIRSKRRKRIRGKGEGKQHTNADITEKVVQALGTRCVSEATADMKRPESQSNSRVSDIYLVILMLSMLPVVWPLGAI